MVGIYIFIGACILISVAAVIKGIKSKSSKSEIIKDNSDNNVSSPINVPENNLSSAAHNSTTHVYKEPDYVYTDSSMSYYGKSLEETQKEHAKIIKSRERQIKIRNQIRN